MQPDFWNAIRRLGMAGADRAAWSREAGDDYDLLEPHLAVIPGREAICSPCRQCGDIRFYSNADEGMWILEPRDHCSSCEPEIITSRQEMDVLQLNRRGLAQAISGPLKFIASGHTGDGFSRIMLIGLWSRSVTPTRVELLFPTAIGAEHFDALFPEESKNRRIVLHLGLDVENLLKLQDRNVIAVNLPEMLSPLPHGAFAPRQSITEVLARAGMPIQKADDSNPDIAEALRDLRDEVREAPRRTASLLSGSDKKRIRLKHQVSEDDFVANSRFRNINWQGRSYHLGKVQASIVQHLYNANRAHALSGMSKDELFAEVFQTKDKRKWSSTETRVQNYFRYGDAKRLWDDGLIGHNKRGNYFLNLPEPQRDATK